MFIFIDETGSDNRNALRKYGYSLRGKTPVNHALLVRGERVSAIACMSSTGLLDVKTITGTSDGDAFYDFVNTNLLPHVMPFNGTNPHSVVILDNCSIHHVPEVAKSIQDVGALLIYLPPYSLPHQKVNSVRNVIRKRLNQFQAQGHYCFKLAGEVVHMSYHDIALFRRIDDLLLCNYNLYFPGLSSQE